MSVLGPGASGIVVATPDAEEAAGLRSDLEAKGLRAATLPELGLDTPAPPDDPALLARFWAESLRRPVISGTAAAAADGSSGSIMDIEALAEKQVPRRVAVFGGAWTRAEEQDHVDAVRLGAKLAGSGVQVVSGGYQGIMDAVSRGAAEAGGTAVGVTIADWEDRATVSPSLTHEVRARDLFARLPLICDAEAWIAFSGGAGTLAEVALCWNLLQADPEPARPLVVIGDRWGRAIRTMREHLVVVEERDWDLIRVAGDGEEAAGLVAAALEDLASS